MSAVMIKKAKSEEMKYLQAFIIPLSSASFSLKYFSKAFTRATIAQQKN
jgi:hypothetical protein